MSFRITIDNLQDHFTAAPEQNLLDAALKAGFQLPYSCRGGDCGSCKAKLLRGDIENPKAINGLNQAEQDEGYILLCQAYAASDLSINAYPINQKMNMQISNLPCRVKSLQPLSPDVMELTVSLPPNQSLDYLAGQYIDFILRDKRHRSYSMAHRPSTENELTFHIKHYEGGRFSGQVFKHMKPKTILRFEGPLGTFFVRDDRPESILMVATGTGFAPLQAMIEDLLTREDQRPIHLIWGVRTRADLYAESIASEWAAQHAHIQFTPVLSQPDDEWTGEQGYVQDVIKAQYEDLSDHQAYLSGLPQMVDNCRALATELGMPNEHIFADAFEPAVS